MIQEDERPPIAVAYVRRASADDARYLKAIVDAGGTPLSLHSPDEGWEDVLGRAHGLLLIGGGDIGPALYGGAESPVCRGVDRTRDQLELNAFRRAAARRMPVLGICRGLQFLNVVFADDGKRGTLIQDLPVGALEHRALPDGTSSFHEVEVLAGTRLAAAVGRAGVLRANSRHHQGLKEEHLARGLIASGLAPDGVVEGLEAPGDWFLLGVQCHPERPGEAPEMARVFGALVAAARAWRS